MWQDPALHTHRSACMQQGLAVKDAGQQHHFGTQGFTLLRVLISSQAATWRPSLGSEHFSHNPSIFPAPLPGTEVFSSLFCKQGIEAGRKQPLIPHAPLELPEDVALPSSSGAVAVPAYWAHFHPTAQAAMGLHQKLGTLVFPDSCCLGLEQECSPGSDVGPMASPRCPGAGGGLSCAAAPPAW